MIPLNARMAIIFVLAIAARIAFHEYTDFIADDAFITYRYARNLIEGHGFVYNVGQQVLGTSTPLFTLLLASLATFGITIPTAALWVSYLSAGLTAVVIYRFANSLRFTNLAILPVIMYILWPRSLVADTCGMETAFFTMLLTAAFYYQHRGLSVYAIGMATLATVTRPEGGILLALLFVFNVYRDPRSWWRYILTPIILLGPWIVFAWLYFGSPIPNSVAAKLALYSRWGTSSVWDTLVYLLAWHNPFGWFMTIAVIVGARWTIKKQNWGYLELTWLVAMILFFTLSPTRVFFWYIPPIYPIYLLFGAAAFRWALDRVSSPDFEWAKRRRYLSGGIIAVVLLGLLAGNYQPLTYYDNYQEALEAAHRRIGFYLFQYSDEDAVVAAEDIGYMGYYSRREILDRDGLVSPQVHDLNAEGKYLEVILQSDPDWVVAAEESPISQFVADSAFLAQYELKESFGEEPYVYRLYYSTSGGE